MTDQFEFWGIVDNERAVAENVITVEPGKVKLYLESEADIPFWYAIFKRFAPKLDIEFEFYALSSDGKVVESSYCSEVQNMQNKKLRGKDFLFKLVSENPEVVGSNKVICVDSDYNYLVRNSEYAQIIQKYIPYIFQTYTYSIENYKCLAESLDGICVDATYNTPNQFSLTRFLIDYSKAIYDLFVYFIYSCFSGIELVTEFGKNIAIPEDLSLDNNGAKTIEEIKSKAFNMINDAKAKLKILNPNYESEITVTRKILADSGVFPENVYLFMKGHILFDDVVCRLLRKIVSTTSAEMIKEINSRSDKERVSKKVKKKRHASYIEMTLDYKSLLNTNKAHFYYNCPLLNNIKKDIERFINEHNKI